MSDTLLDYGSDEQKKATNSHHMKTSEPWAEFYRPKTLDDCILPRSIRNTAKGIIENQSLPNLLLTGEPGTGKTTLARVLASELQYDMLFINGSNEGRFIDTLRTKVQGFASASSFEGRRRLVLLDEADNLPAETVQMAMRAFFEEFSSNCSFILTCNYPRKIIDALHSRMSEVEFVIPNDEKAKLMIGMANRVFNILDSNSITYDKKAVALLVKDKFPNFRKVLNDLQRYSATGTVDFGAINNAVNTNYDVLVKSFKDGNWKDMRKWVASQSSLDYTRVSRYLFDNRTDIFKSELTAQLVITLADYQAKNAVAEDKEINMVAMLTELMMMK